MKRMSQALTFVLVVLIAPWVNAQGSYRAYEIVPGVRVGVVKPGMSVDDAARVMSAYGTVYQDDDGDPRVDFARKGSLVIGHLERDPARVDRAIVFGEPSFTVRDHAELHTGIGENPEGGAMAGQWVAVFGEPDIQGPLSFGKYMVWSAGIGALFDCTHGACGTVAIEVFATDSEGSVSK